MSSVVASSVTVAIDGHPVVNGVDLTVAPGTWHSIVGPNGAGKTSLVETVAGVRRPSSGSVSVLGHDIHRLREQARARQVAFVPQHPIVPSGMSVADYVGLGRTAHRGALRPAGDDDRAIVSGVLDRLDITTFAHRDVASLSGGERQRVILARALAQHTLVLVMDEPITGLDLRHQIDLLSIVRREVDECGLAVVATLHDLTLAAQFADQMSLLDSGRIVASGRPADVLRSPQLTSSYGVELHVVDVAGADVVVPAPLRERSHTPVS